MFRCEQHRVWCVETCHDCLPGGGGQPQRRWPSFSFSSQEAKVRFTKPAALDPAPLVSIIATDTFPQHLASRSHPLPLSCLDRWSIQPKLSAAPQW